MLAAAFEEAGLELINDNGYTPVPPELIAASFEGHGYEDEGWEEGEDDKAPGPPDMIAASFEAGYGYEEEKLEEADGEEAPRPPDMNASSFEGHSYKEEEKWEEGEDDRAPRPPSMISAACGENDAADHKAKKKPTKVIEDGVDHQVPDKRTASAHEAEENITIRQEIVNRVMQQISEAFDNYGTPANTRNQGSLLDRSSSLNQSPFTASSVQVGASSISPTPQRGAEPSLVANSQGLGGITIHSTEDQMPPHSPNFDPSQQSLPLLEATLVQDVPNEPVYIYI